ncbi:hypothetical protein BLNAU_9848 [Blattamonas nauphoetae]|uniref:Uncharacterized protein n=1 Tax=Blattamonas nauphoetae TaxID=2049346 RepID=A0ABQ9XUG5_9EUKA|nr:hypothetical protein BLNAU_16550 [Blattamonas nauphoetae]KAK2950997.1 hypothetical protein BLNAU_14075 [Blattamonas nauphoetae]KAK2955119.1 hypothetical protein BLNAU_9848 [Blattamonas nauphoetae]
MLVLTCSACSSMMKRGWDGERSIRLCILTYLSQLWIVRTERSRVNGRASAFHVDSAKYGSVKDDDVMYVIACSRTLAPLIHKHNEMSEFERVDDVDASELVSIVRCPPTIRMKISGNESERTTSTFPLLPLLTTNEGEQAVPLSLSIQTQSQLRAEATFSLVLNEQCRFRSPQNNVESAVDAEAAKIITSSGRETVESDNVAPKMVHP